MTNNELNTIGTMMVYACGGMGINAGAYFNGATEEPNCANIEVAYIDTSRSNLKQDFNKENIFILDNVDGSGKVRKENHKEVSNVVKQILLQHEPAEFNVVVFSASGGSGSVIGPLLLSELLERNKNAVCVVVGSDESIITAQNTLNSLKSLESISKKTKLPVVMYYEQNDQEKKRSDVDTQVHLVISTLAILSSKKNREMDTQDIANWVKFNKTTSVVPQLSLLEVFTDPKVAESVKDPISIASVYASDQIATLKCIPEYIATGFLTEPVQHFDQLHFIITTDPISRIVNRVKETLDGYLNQRDSRVKLSSIISDKDTISDDGLIL